MFCLGSVLVDHILLSMSCVYFTYKMIAFKLPCNVLFLFLNEFLFLLLDDC